METNETDENITTGTTEEIATATETVITSDILEEFFVCDECNSKTQIADRVHLPNGSTICQDCYSDSYTECRHCGEILLSDDATYISTQSEYVCESCYERRDYFTCDACGEILQGNRYHSDGYCDDCYENGEEENEENNRCIGGNRNYDRSDKLVTLGIRAFSCEIECYPNPEKRGQSVTTVLDTIDKGIGMSNDGSLNSYGKEFQTPKLSGKKGEKVLRGLCKALNDNNFFVDRSCGLHIHLDTEDFKGNTEKIKRLMLFYIAFESVIYSFLPYSRRVNRFCMPLSKFYHENEIYNVCSLSELEQIWYREQSKTQIDNRKCDKYDSTRYAGVNLHSLLSNGHIEIRHHSGTIHYTKIKNWIELHVSILNLISNGTIETSQINNIKYILDSKKKMEKFFELLNLNKRTKNYFIARYKKFSKETNDTPNICAE